MRAYIVLVALVALLAGCTSQEARGEGAAPAVNPSAVTTDEPAGCNSNDDCGENEYCAKPVGECDSDAGECAVRPEICTHNWNPVCGCDGKTYGNACSAAAKGQSIAYKGECTTPEGL